MGEILQAFAIDLSGYTEEWVYVQCFVQPLYVPAKHETLNFGYRMRHPRTNSEGWELAEMDAASHHIAEEMQKERVQFPRHYSDPGDFVPYAARTWKSVKTGHKLEALGYSLVRIGAYREAANAMAAAQVGLDLSVDWQRE